jgi:LysR family transcriptional regulator, glycine cleavage system transcriptional activator
LLTLPLIHDGDSTGWRDWFGANGLRLQSKAQDRVVANYALALKAAGAGLGVALANTCFGFRGTADGLVKLALASAPSSVAYYVIVHDKQASATVWKCAELLVRLSS